MVPRTSGIVQLASKSMNGEDNPSWSSDSSTCDILDSALGSWSDQNCYCSVEDSNGSSSLCYACRSLFDGSKKKGIKYKHLQFLSTLRRNAREGCGLCALLEERFNANSPEGFNGNLDLEICVESASRNGSSVSVRVCVIYKCLQARYRYHTLVLVPVRGWLSQVPDKSRILMKKI